MADGPITVTDDYRMPKLNAENYHTWKIRARAVLVQKNIWEAVEPGYDEIINDEQRRRNEKALTFLFLVIDDAYIDDVSTCVMAKEAWDILRDIHTKHGLLHKVQILKEFVTTEKRKTESIRDYIARFTDLHRKVLGNGLVFENRELAALLLCGLPSEYDILINSLDKAEDDLTLTFVKSKLITEEKRINYRDNKCKDDINNDERRFTQALVSKKNNKNVGKPNTGGKKVTFTEQDVKGSGVRDERMRRCFTCGRMGHIARHCKFAIDELNRRKFGTGTNSKLDPNDIEGDRKASIASVNTAENENYQALCATSSCNGKCAHWIIDSGATDHMSPHKEKFCNLRVVNAWVNTASGERMNVKGIGDVKLHFSKECGYRRIELKQVLFVPDLEENLISITRVEEKGCSVVFSNGQAKIIDQRDSILIRAIRKGSLYCAIEEGGSQAHMSSKEEYLWHQRLGHVHMDAVKIIKGRIECTSDDAVDKGQTTEGMTTERKCDTCMKGKMRRNSYNTSDSSKSKAPLDLIHSDVVGKITPESKGGAAYFVTFIDDYSRHVTAYTMKRKNETLERFKQYKSEVENLHDSKIKAFKCDMGGEYTGLDFNNFLQENGISRQFSAPHTPQQNGLPERENLTIMDMVRCFLIQSGVPDCFWGDAVMTACYIRNRCPSKGINGEIPMQRWTGKMDDLNHLRVFGCKVWALNTERRKLDPKAEEYVLIGYPPGIKGYKLWNRWTNCIKISNDVRFDENVFPCRPTQDIDVTMRMKDINLKVEETTNPHDVTDSISKGGVNIIPLRRSERIKSRTSGQPQMENDPRQSCYNCTGSDRIAGIREPKTVREALEGQESSEWVCAMKEEMQNHARNETWTIVERPQKERVLGSKWIFKLKSNVAGEVVRFKARLVAQGWNQRAGVDYENSYSPVVKLKSLRLIMAIAVERDWTSRHLDVVSAYLNSSVEETVYMEIPDLFTCTENFDLAISNDEDKCNTVQAGKSKNYVCLLRKAIYGLCQSGHAWNTCMDKYLKSIGLKQSRADPCIYFSSDIIIALYVDDVALFGTKDAIEMVTDKLKQRFEIKDLGEVRCFLSLQVTALEGGGLSISQTNFVREVLVESGMIESKHVSTPLTQGLELKRDENDNIDQALNVEYRKIVGSLLYLANATRPDLSYPTSFLSQFNDRATTEHRMAAKHTLRYLSGSRDAVIEFTKKEESISIYCDADWASDKHDRKSFSGYMVILSGGAVSWSSRKQRTVALSTVEAEYLALTEAVKEALWLQTFLQEIGAEELINVPTKIYIDNRGSISLGKNKVTSERSKHIDIRHHFVRDVIEQGKIELCYIPTNDNLADMMTKTISGLKLNRMMGLVGVKFNRGCLKKGKC